MLSDEKSRIAALSINESFIVQAPAGSGKTSLLVQRFINLLNKCNFPEECLAITFTRKAALEMRTRVLLALEDLVKFNQYPENHIYLRILQDPNKLQISTIDAFALNLIKKTPLLSKFWINFSINEDPKLLYKEAVENLLSMFDDFDIKMQNFKNVQNIDISYELKPLINLLEYFSNNYQLIQELLINLLSKREQWLPLIIPIKLSNISNGIAHNSSANYEHNDFSYINVRNLLENNLKSTFEEVLIEMHNYLPSKSKQTEILDLAKYAANNIEDASNPIINCRYLSDAWPEAKYECLPLWKGLRELLLTKDGKSRVKLNAVQGFINPNNIKDIQQKKVAIEYKSKMEQLLEDLKLNSKFFLSKLHQINIIPEQHKYMDDNWNFLQSLIELLPKLVAHLMLVFQEHRMVDFTQINIAALEAIDDENHLPDLSLILEYNLKHILIDEFQDTSNLQFNLLEKLISNWEPYDGRTIFIVGDPMQSIYRFRQANVGLFLKVQQVGISKLKPINLTLTTNFRSGVGLIQQFNNLFSKIFPLNDDLIYGGVKYNLATQASIVSSENIDKILNNSEVKFFSTNNVDEEAEHIVDLIKKIKKLDIKPSVAILFRFKSQADLIIKKLKQYNIIYQANDLELFANQEVINDLLMLTRSILHVNDKVAWFSLLRGPFVGLKLQDLNALFENGDGFHIPLLTQLINYTSNYKSNAYYESQSNYNMHSKSHAILSEEAYIRLNYIVPILIDAINQVELHDRPIAQIIKSTWLKLGGNLIIYEHELDLIENFFYKLATIDEPLNIGCIDDIIENHFIELNTYDSNSDAVQLMTIHKAKGLEFDIIIIPDIDKGSKNSQNQLLLWELRNSLNNQKNYDNYLLFAPIKASHQTFRDPIYDFMKFSEEERDLHEAKRLLYVAFTRAKKKVFGFMSNNNYTHSSKSFFTFLEPYIICNKLINLNSINELNSSEAESITLYRLPNSWYVKYLC